MADVIRFFTPGDSDALRKARQASKDAQDYAVLADGDAQAVETARQQVAAATPQVLAARDTVVPLANDVAAATPQVLAARDTVVPLASQVATNAAQTTADRLAAAAAAAAAGGSVPVTADRTVGRRAGDPGAWPVVRSTPVHGWGPTGALEETPPDTIRFDFDPVTKASLGAQFQPFRINRCRNPRAEGLVAGSPGTVPPGWSITTASGGITRELVGYGTEDGVPGFYVRFAGTATANGQFAVTPASDADTSAAQGETHVAALWWKMAAGGLTGIGTCTLELYESNNGSALVSSSTTVVPPATLTRIQRTRTFSNALANRSRAVLTIRTVSGAAVNITLFFALPFLGLGSFAPLPVLPPLGAPAVTVAAQTSVSIPVADLGSRWSYRQGLILFDWISQPGPFTSANDADWMGLMSWGDGTPNERMGILINPAHTRLEARVTAGGIVQPVAFLTITPPAAGARVRSGLVWDADAGKLQVLGLGTYGAQVALSALPAAGFAMPGCYGPTHPGAIWLSGFDPRPAALFDAAGGMLT